MAARMGRVRPGVAAILAGIGLAAGAGCSGAGRYAKARALDFWDMLPVSVSKGVGGTAWVRATPLFMTGIGWYEGRAYGLAPGRWGGSWKTTCGGFVLLAGDDHEFEKEKDLYPTRWQGGPDTRHLEIGYDQYRDKFDLDDSKLHRTSTNALFLFPCTLPHTPGGAWPPLHAWLDVEADLFIGVAGLHAGFCPSQVVDFLFGLFGLDPLGDDPDGRREREIREKYETPVRDSKEADSSAFPSTVVLAAPDAPIPSGKSAVWCGSLEVAWSRLASAVKGLPIISGAEEPYGRPNASAAMKNHLPAGSFCAEAGWIEDGVLEEIRMKIPVDFPDVPPPDLDGPRNAAVAYAHFQHAVKFYISFLDSQAPLAFKDSSGRETTVKAFGLQKKDRTRSRLRERTEVLYLDAPSREFVIASSFTPSPAQIILARVSKKDSLSETLSFVEGKISGAKGRALQENDVLLVPHVVFWIAHHFRGLEGRDRAFLNPGAEGRWIEHVVHSIRFRLDGYGDDPRPEDAAGVARADAAGGPFAPFDFVFDRPFLIYMKMRRETGGGKPFFALWIDGAELLETW